MGTEENGSIGDALDHYKGQILSDLKQEAASRNLFSTQKGDWDTEALQEHLQRYFEHFRQAVAMSHPPLFSEFLQWASSVQKSRSSEGATLPELNDLFRQLLEKHLDSEYADKAIDFLDRAVADSEKSDGDFLESYLDEEHELADMARTYFEHLLNGDRKKASGLIMDAVDEGVPVKDIYLHVFQPCQYEIGRLWQLNRLSVAQEHFCTAATQMVMSQLYSHIFSKERINKSVVAVTLGGQLHEIGIRMVADFFEMEGWDTFYLGANCPSDEIVEELIDRDADLLALSVTMASALGEAEKLIQRVKNHDKLTNCRVMVGGRPFRLSEELWKKIGADGFASDAKKAIEIATGIVEEKEDATKF